MFKREASKSMREGEEGFNDTVDVSQVRAHRLCITPHPHPPARSRCSRLPSGVSSAALQDGSALPPPSGPAPRRAIASFADLCTHCNCTC